MSEHAPELGSPTDIENLDDELDVDTDDESTIKTPDELGGTGGQQPGGAG
jgi:hypothetical protein